MENAQILLGDYIHFITNSEKEGLVLIGPVKLPIEINNEIAVFNWYCWMQEESSDTSIENLLSKLKSKQLQDFQQSSVLVYGDFENSEESFVRFHSICHTGDIFGSQRCDCGAQLKKALSLIIDHGSGALFYLSQHEGRGIGLFSKCLTYILQENGYDTISANLELGFPADNRKYDDACTILKFLRSKPIRLITNNPLKINALLDNKVLIKGKISIWENINKFNKMYIQTKKVKSHHYIK